MPSGPEPAGAMLSEEDDSAGAAEVSAGAAEVASALVAGAVDEPLVDELLLRATTIIASNTTAAITAMTTREDERCALVLPALLGEDFGGVADAVERGSGVEEIDERPPESGTSGITMRDAERLAVFFDERFAVFLTVRLAVFFTARFAVFFTADFFAVFLTARLAVFFTARFAEVFFAADFFAVFLAVFFTATLSPLDELIIENQLMLTHKLLRK
jgi:hypothetical protein